MMVDTMKEQTAAEKLTPDWNRSNPQYIRSLQLKKGYNDCFMQKQVCKKVGCQWWESCVSH